MDHAKLATLTQAAQVAHGAPLPAVIWRLLETCREGTPEEERDTALVDAVRWLGEVPGPPLFDLAMLLASPDGRGAPVLYRELCARVGV